jgi:multidrug transporter EmrE-like cation transporter
MDSWHVAAALLSAGLHAGWNAAVKASVRPVEVMTAQMVAGAILVLPMLLWTGLPNPASWIWIAVGTVLNLATVTALLKAYALVGFGLVYPVARAIAVLLVVPFAVLLAGETLSLHGLMGVGLMVAALVVLAIGNASADALPKAALVLIAAAGAGTAASVMCDAQGVRSAGSTLAYGCLVSITNAVAMFLRQNGFTRPWRVVERHAATAVPIAIASMASYLLILWVWSGAPIAPAAALRDSSAVFALLIAIFWLKEPFTPLRLMAIMLAAAAVPLLRFA